MTKIIALVMIITIGVFAAACTGNTTNNVNNRATNKNATIANNSANSNSTNRRENEHEMTNGEHGGMGNRRMEKGMGMRPGVNHNANSNQGWNRDPK